MKNVVFWDVTSSGSCKNRRFVMRLEGISELGTTLAVTIYCNCNAGGGDWGGVVVETALHV
jgi:hypothetical protein